MGDNELAVSELHSRKVPNKMKVKPVIKFRCQCGGWCTHATGSGGAQLLIHTLPYCTEFEQMDPADYLKRNRLWIKRQRMN